MPCILLSSPSAALFHPLKSVMLCLSKTDLTSCAINPYNLSLWSASVLFGSWLLNSLGCSEGDFHLNVTVRKSLRKSKPQSSFVLISFFNRSSEERVQVALEEKSLYTLLVFPLPIEILSAPTLVTL